MLVKLLLTIAFCGMVTTKMQTTENHFSKDDLAYSFYCEFDEFCADFAKQYGEDWDGGKAIGQKMLLKNNEKIGTVICFENGYVCVTDDFQLLEISDEKRPYGWNTVKHYILEKNRVFASINNHFYSLSGETSELFSEETCQAYCAENISSYFHTVDEVRGYGDFRLSYCFTPFTAIPESLLADNATFATWNSMCMYQGDWICAICAAVNLLLTYKYSTNGVVDCTKGLTPEEMYVLIHIFTKNGENGSFEPTFAFDVNKYMDGTGYYFLDGDGDGLVPHIKNYHFNGDLFHGHTVLVIGYASTSYWWIFRSYWDIVLTWHRNYSVDSSGVLTLDLDNASSIRLVDSQYATGGYCLCRNGLLVTQGNASWL